MTHLPTYRILTGPDDDRFCHRVSHALERGYQLYGSPGLTVKGDSAYVAQALIWPGPGPTPVRDESD